MGDVPAIVVMWVIPASLAAGHAIRRLGEEVVRGSFAAQRGKPPAEPVVADDGVHRSADRRRDHRSL